MTRQVFAIGCLMTTLAVGCGESDPIQPKPGSAPAPRTEQEKIQIRTEDEKVDAAEKGNTPKAPPKKR